MFFKRIISDLVASNCYIIGDSGEAAVIDPGVDNEIIKAELDEQKLRLKYIVFTHAHIDHIMYMEELQRDCGGQTAVHEADAPLLGSAMYNGSMLFGMNKTFKDADIKLKDGDVLEVGDLKLYIIHTPGHTPGGICIKAGDCLMTGDTLFKLSVGRTDLGMGDQDRLMDSLKKIMKLDDSIKVFPGHGAPTDIGYERKNNIYIREVCF